MVGVCVHQWHPTTTQVIITLLVSSPIWLFTRWKHSTLVPLRWDQAYISPFLLISYGLMTMCHILTDKNRHCTSSYSKGWQRYIIHLISLKTLLVPLMNQMCQISASIATLPSWFLTKGIHSTSSWAANNFVAKTIHAHNQLICPTTIVILLLTFPS